MNFYTPVSRSTSSREKLSGLHFSESPYVINIKQEEDISAKQEQYIRVKQDDVVNIKQEEDI